MVGVSQILARLSPGMTVPTTHAGQPSHETYRLSPGMTVPTTQAGQPSLETYLG